MTVIRTAIFSKLSHVNIMFSFKISLCWLLSKNIQSHWKQRNKLLSVAFENFMLRYFKMSGNCKQIEESWYGMLAYFCLFFHYGLTNHRAKLPPFARIITFKNSYIHIHTNICKSAFLSRSKRLDGKNANKSTKQLSILDWGGTSTSFWTQWVILPPGYFQVGHSIG